MGWETQRGREIQSGVASRLWTFAVAGIGALMASVSLPACAQMAPVLAGMWEVRTLTSYLPAGTQAQAQARRYRVCIGPERTRSPMLPRSMGPATELVFDRQGYTGYADQPAAADAPSRKLEFSYRRLSPRAFEGTHDVNSGERAAWLQYHAQYLGPDCGKAPVSGPQDSGEP